MTEEYTLRRVETPELQDIVGYFCTHVVGSGVVGALTYGLGSLLFDDRSTLPSTCGAAASCLAVLPGFMATWPLLGKYLAWREDRRDKEERERKPVSFSYGGSGEVVSIRPEHSNGHEFLFSTTDPGLDGLVFSYMPKKDTSLRFDFTIKDWWEDPSYHTSPLEHSQLRQTMIDKAERLCSPVKGYRCKVDDTSEVLHFTITYTGEQYDKNLLTFGSLVSGVLNMTSGFREMARKERTGSAEGA